MSTSPLLARPVFGRFARRWWGLLLVLSGFWSTLSAQSLPPGFSSNQVQTGYSIPVGAIFSTDGQQLFVWEKGGRLFVSNWNGSTYVRQTTPLIDIRDEVGNWGDGGFLSVCLDPNFSSNGLIYLYYVVDRHHLLYYGTPQYNAGVNEYDNASISRITRYRVTSTGGTLTADPNSRQVLLGETKTTGIPMVYPSHVGGTLVFGRDGSLLVSTGDNAFYDGVDVGSQQNTYYQAAVNDGIMRPAENVGALRCQMIGSLCGKVLRIDPANGNGLASNPFFDGNARSARSRVWATGLRNPYRMTLQPATGSTNAGDGNPGTLLVGDVGWSTAEDFNVINKAGLNFGWPLYEGMDKTSGYYGRNLRNQDEPGQPTFESLCVPPTSPNPDPNPANRRFTHARPALDWMHGPATARVPAFEGTTPTTRTIGTPGAPAGVPFNGRAAIGGAYYTGNQFPTTYQNSYFFADFDQNWIRNLTLDDNMVREVRTFAASGTGQGIVDLEVNPLDGSLFFVNTSGQVVRISYGGNQPPVARPSANITSGNAPLSVQFNSTASADPEAKPLTFRWDFGDGTSSTLANPEHTFNATDERSFSVTLTVTDQGQLSHTSPPLLISLNSAAAPTARITSPAPNTLYPLDRASLYTLTAEVTGANLTYEWQLTLVHNTHEHPEAVMTQTSPQIRLSPVGCSGADTYSYRVNLKVTNRSGLSATTSLVLLPDCQSANGAVRQLTASPQVSSVGLSWQNPSLAFEEVLVAARPQGGFQDNPSGTSYTADADYGGRGSVMEGGRVVYRGRDQGVVVRGLGATVPYYFRVYTRIGESWNGGVEVSATPLPNPTTPPPTTPPAGGALSLLAPTYTCSSGAISFRTSGGNNTLIEYAAAGITDWTSNPNHTLDAGIRRDPKVLLLRARQSDLIVSYSFDLPAACATGTPPPTTPPANQPPRLVQAIPAQTATVGQAYSLTIPAGIFTDPENQALTYAISNLPPGLRFETQTSTLTGTPTTAGQTTLTLTATDPGNLSASTSFVLTVNPATTPPPTTPPTTPPAGGALSLLAPTYNCSSGAISFRTSGGNNTLIEYAAAGITDWTANPNHTLDAGIRRDPKVLLLRARQSDVIVSYSFDLPAACATGTPPPTTPPANQPPRLVQAIPAQTATVGQAYSLTIPAGIFTDPENQALTYAISNLPPGLRFETQTSTLTGTPTTAGQTTLTLTATDPGNLSASTSFVLTVNPATTPPPTTPPTTPPAGGALSLLAPTYNCSSGAISFRTSGGNNTLIEYAAAGITDWTANPNHTLDAGIRRDPKVLLLRARQSDVIVTYSFDLPAACATGTPPPTTPPANQPPRLVQAIPAQTATVGQAYSLTIPAGIFTDPENQALTYAISNLPPGLRFETQTSTLTGTPTTAGQTTLTLTATDPGNLSASTSFVLTVNPATTPPPTTPPTTPPAGGALSLLAPTYNCSSGAISFRTSGGNNTLIEYAAAGITDWTANPNHTLDAGIRRDPKVLLLRARQSDVIVSYSFDLPAACATGTPPPTTPPANQPPRLVQAIPAQTATVGQAYSLTIPAGIFTDPENQALTYAISNLPPGLRFETQTSTLTGTPTTAGQTTLTLTATDPGNLSASTSFVLTVNPATTPPPTTPPTTPPAGGALSLLAPTYNCSSGAISFRTSGGNNTLIEYAAAGITDWTANPNHTLDAGIRRDPKVMLLRARQNGVIVSYSFDLPATCPVGSGRQGAEPTQVLTVRLLGNPVLTETAEVEIRGEVGEQLHFQLLDSRGRFTNETIINQVSPVERHFVKLPGSTGLYLLRVSTPTQHRIVKLLKQ